ncbi:MAG: glycerol acyltransferase, partial [Prolixibacteraceae bacterium]|nr:glycerol acyltransferase [Prolixibacteraceae bacterium]
AGMVSRKQGKVIRDLEWKKNFISKTVQFQRDVVPIHFFGHNSKFFYWLANFRKRIGLPNIELMLLPSELFKHRNHSFTIKIEKPIPWQTFNKSKTPAEWAEYVKNAVYGL